MPNFTGTITQPGLYADVPEAQYHGDPVPETSLSVSGAKILLERGGPAKFAWAREHGKIATRAQKLGTTAHALTLGKGADIAVLEYENRRTDKCKNAEKEAIAAGRLPVLRKDYEEARQIADALLTHPTAGPLLEGIDAEVSGFWRDPQLPIWLRMRMDGHRLDYEMPTILDVKTSKDASPDGFAKSVHEWGYFRQDPWYREGLAAWLGCEWDDVDFIFIVVENEPPYLVATYRVSDGSRDEWGAPTPDDVRLGREQIRIARERFADCTASGNWPGYSLEIERIELPRYRRQDTERQVSEWYR